MGQGLAKEHEVGEQVAVGGVWKVHSAKRLSSKEEVSLWVYDKAPGAKEVYLELLRKEGNTLKKLRHPGIISVHKVEETKTSIVIETEPVVCSLADALRRDARSFDEFDVKTGLLQICEALVFLHSRCETALLALSPDVVWVTRKGPWKLGGAFAFAQATKGPGFGPPVAFSADAIATLNTPQSIAPLLEYAAPEAVLQKRFTEKSDIFSLGCLLYDLSQTLPYRRLRPIRSLGEYQAQTNLLMNAVNGRPSGGEGPSVDGFSQLTLDTLQQLMAHDEARRPTAAEFLRGAFFNDVLLRTVVFVGSLVDKNEAEKGGFLKGLPQVLPQFPASVVSNRILPALLAELSPNTPPSLLPLLLNCILLCERTRGSCSEAMLTAMAKAGVFTTADPSISSALLQGLDLLLGCGVELATLHIVPVLCRNIEAAPQMPRLADTTFKAIAKSANLIPTAALRAQLLPRIFEVVCTDTLPVLVRANGIVCVNKLIPLLDAGSAVEFILPLLDMLMSKPDTLKTLQLLVHIPVSSLLTLHQMAIVWTYDALGRKVGGALIMSRILPALSPLVIYAPFDLQQYTTVMQVIGELLARADADLKKEYERRMAKPTEITPPPTAAPDPQQDFMSLVSKAYTTKTAVSSKPAAPAAPPPMSPIAADLHALASNDTSSPFGSSISSAASAVSSSVVAPSSLSAPSTMSSPPLYPTPLSSSSSPSSSIASTPAASSLPWLNPVSSSPSSTPSSSAPSPSFPSTPLPGNVSKGPRSLGTMAGGGDPFGDSGSFGALITQAKLEAVAPPPAMPPKQPAVAQASAADDIFAALSAPLPAPTPTPPPPQQVPPTLSPSPFVSSLLSSSVPTMKPAPAPAPVVAPASPTPTSPTTSTWKPLADDDDDFFDPRRR